MKNPPDFVMYVVMVKLPRGDKDRFYPCWGTWGAWAYPPVGVYAKGFARKRDAEQECRLYRLRYGKKNAYVQQYGPYLFPLARNRE